MSGLHVRPVRPDDAAAIAAIYTPFVRDGVVSFELDPPDASTMRTRIETVSRDFPWLVAERDGTLLAYAYAGTFRTRAAYRWTVETTVYVDSGHARQGIGRALYAELLDEAARRGFVTAIGIVTLPNAPSEGLHAAMGFVDAGTWKGVGYKFGRWHDIGVWQRDLAPRVESPAEPFAHG